MDNHTLPVVIRAAIMRGLRDDGGLQQVQDSILDLPIVCAAPDMLAALQAVVDAGDEYWTDDFHLARCLAKAAIAKAEAH